MSDQPINHPDHYGGEDDPYEVIKILKAVLTPEEYQGFCKGNVLKYVMRAGKKGGPPMVPVDLGKGRNYLDFALEALNG